MERRRGAEQKSVTGKFRCGPQRGHTLVDSFAPQGNNFSYRGRHFVAKKSQQKQQQQGEKWLEMRVFRPF